MSASEHTVDVDKIKSAARNNQPIALRTHTLPRDFELYLEEVLAIVLEELDLLKMKDYLIYCLRELAVNAKKANIKRVYFKSLGLDIDDPSAYEEGMRDFRTATMDNIDHYLRSLADQGYYIRIIVHAQATALVLETRNNAEINQREYLRVHDKLARARQYATLEEALGQILDSAEGPGLGLVILALMLKKLGLPEDECFDIWAEDGETVARITVPIAEARIRSLSLLTDEIVRSVAAFPSSPSTLARLKAMIPDPRSDIADIARSVYEDPQLSAELLRLAGGTQGIGSPDGAWIEDAVRRVGLLGMRSAADACGAADAQDDGERKGREEEEARRAHYASCLARESSPAAKELPGEASAAAKLLDIGQAVLRTDNAAALEKLQSFCAEKGISSGALDGIAGGMNHAELGARIAEKWNFPSSLVESIRYHHAPGYAPREYRDIVRCVYMADMLCMYESARVEFEQIDSNVLREFGVRNKDQIRKLIDRLSESYRLAADPAGDRAHPPA